MQKQNPFTFTQIPVKANKHKTKQMVNIRSTTIPSDLTSQIFTSQVKSMSALMLLVGRQEGHLACKKTEWWDVGVIVWDEVQSCTWPSRCHCHSLSLAAVNPDWF